LESLFNDIIFAFHKQAICPACISILGGFFFANKQTMI